MARCRGILVLLAAGLLVSVAIAWLCAWVHLPHCGRAVEIHRYGAAASRGWPAGFRAWEFLSWSEGWTVPAPRRMVVPLPLTPVWWGLILNTVVYALALHEVASIIRTARKRRRLRRGLCGACGYPALDFKYLSRMRHPT